MCTHRESMSYDDDDDDDDDDEIVIRPNQFPSIPFRNFGDSVEEMTSTYKNLSKLYFYNEYRTIPKESIDKILSQCKFHLLPAYQKFAEKKEVNGGKQIAVGDEVITLLRKSRDQELFHPQSDMVFFQEYLFVEEKKLWALEKKKSAESHEALIKQQQSIGRKVAECPICCEEYLWTEIIRCSNKEHFCCPGCIDTVINKRITANNPNRGCFETGCDGGIAVSDLSKVLGKQMFAQFERAEKDKLLQQSNNKCLSRCPVCNYGLYFDKVPESSSSSDDDDDKALGVDDASLVKYPVFDCPKCMQKTCRRCKQSDHRPKLCANEADESEEALIRYVTNAMSQARIRHCPTCKTPAIKTTNSNMIACEGCQHFYCYNCEWKLDDNNHYKHFGGVNEKGVKENNCPLYYKGNNTIEADRQRVVKKAEEAIAKWRKLHPQYLNFDEKKLRKIIDSGV